ncbi:MAG: alginate lyase family protein [Balneolales bacterium]
MPGKFYNMVLLSGFFLVTGFGTISAQPSIDRGLINTPEQYEFMRQMVAQREEPWISGYEIIPKYLEHQPQPHKHYVDPAAHQGPPDDMINSALGSDSQAAYASALHWIISREEDHVEKTIEILNAWAWELERINPWQDGPLSTSYNWPRMIYAADIIRKTYDGWAQADQDQFADVLRNIVWKGTGGRGINKDNKNNWRSHAVHARMTISVYLEEEQWFNESVEILKDQIGSYCYPSGQSIETARDVWHVQMGLSGMVAASEIAWHQGVDAYGYLNNRLLTCVEWHIPHIVGLEDADWPDSFDSPFYAPDHLREEDDYVAIWDREVPVRSGNFDGPRNTGRVYHFYEKVFNHYHGRKGMDAPYTKKILTEESPERAARTAGWGTLTHRKLYPAGE